MLDPVSASLLFFCLGSYLLGSISSAILISQYFDLPDPRYHGSNNPGATNMLRLGGKRPAALTLLCDATKGALPVTLAYALDYTSSQQAWIGLCAVIGHVFPIYYKFNGGKGVATAIGVIGVLNYALGLIYLVLWAVLVKASKTSSIGSLLGGALTFILAIYQEEAFLVPLAIMFLIILLRHITNLKSLRSGKERKII